MKRICTICARGGSRGLPGKNLRPVLGKPVIGHAVEQARDAGIFEAVAVSSDSPEILAVAKAHGADFTVTRPAEMATDAASKLPAIEHCTATVERALGTTFDVIVDLDTTSILRLPDDIRGAVALLESRGVTNVITGCTAHRNPYFNLVERLADGHVALAKRPPRPLDRRQDAPPCFDMNAAVYVWRRGAFKKSPAIFYSDTLLYEMPEERSRDIDTPFDFELVEFVLNRRQRT